MKYIVGDRSFDNRESLLGYIRAILNKYPSGSEIDGGDLLFVSDLLKRHPDAAAKEGSGVRAFKVIIDGYGHRVFIIIRTDGTSTDFSFMKCIRARQHNGYEKFTIAARRAIVGQVLEYKNEYVRLNTDDGVVPCEVTGDVVSINDTVIHHTIAFKEIVDEYITTHKINPDHVEYIMGIDNHIGVEFKDDSLRDDFSTFHASKAKLAIVNSEKHNRYGVKRT